MNARSSLPLTALALASCSAVPQGHSFGEIARTPVATRPFGTTADGKRATAYVLRNANGLEAVVTDYGATLVAMRVPDREGDLADVVLGFDDVSGYESDDNQYFGCTAGRVANRIRLGRFELDGETYELATNNEPNHLHGGDVGFGQRMWQAWPHPRAAEVTFQYTSPDGEEGYPGNLVARVTYTLTDDDALVLTYDATADAATPVNLTHHSYWNLAGHGSPTVLDHVLEIEAAAYTPTDDTLIPTGEIEPVAGTPLDFREPRRIGDRVAALDETAALGYDHNFVLHRGEETFESIADVSSHGLACRLTDPGSGRVLEIYTDQPGLQFYSGNFLFGQTGKDGATYAHRSACCLETQNFPNAVNEPRFPDSVLRPDERYRQICVHRFLTD